MSVKRPVPRQFIGVKIGQSGVTWMDGLIVDMSPVNGRVLTRSDVIRASLAVAKHHERELRDILRVQV